MNPVLTPHYASGSSTGVDQITSISVEHYASFAEEMLAYSQNFGFLPDLN